MSNATYRHKLHLAQERDWAARAGLNVEVRAHTNSALDTIADMAQTLAAAQNDLFALSGRIEEIVAHHDPKGSDSGYLDALRRIHERAATTIGTIQQQLVDLGVRGAEPTLTVDTILGTFQVPHIDRPLAARFHTEAYADS